MSDREADDDLTQTIRNCCIDAALKGYEEALISGVCREGAWEAAISAMRRADLPQPARRDAALGRQADVERTNASLSESVGLLARQFASPGPPAAGSGAAATGAIAAGLLEWIALHLERRGPRSFRKRAGAIGRRAARLQQHLGAAAEQDAEAVRRLIDKGGRRASPEVLVQATESALAIADVCAQAVTLIIELTPQVNGAFRLDALAALRLASGATQSALHLFEVNLRAEEGDAKWRRKVQRQAWRTTLLLERAAVVLGEEGTNLAEQAPA